MADTAAHLVDSVLPHVPVRQWVLTLPFALRYRLAFDAGLTRAVLSIFVRAIFASLRRRTRKGKSLRSPRCGAVTFIQRFGDALNLNVHFHTLALDGVYYRDSRTRARFLTLPPPETREVEAITRRVARGVTRLLVRRGLGPDADLSLADPLPSEDPLLAALYGASVRSRIATGSRAGQRVLRLGDAVDAEDLEVPSSPRCVTVGGLSVHAEVGVPASDRRRLQRLCRYAGRPPVATARLSRLGDGRLLYRLKHRWRDGTTHVVFEPLELLEKLAALVPPPRIHQVRYHGVLGPAAGDRRLFVPALPDSRPDRNCPLPICSIPRERPGGDTTARPADAPVAPALAHAGSEPGLAAPTSSPVMMPPSTGPESDPPGTDPGRVAPPRTLSWAELIRRVFAADVLVCPRCGGRMRILATIQTPQAIRAILDHLGLPSRAPPIAPPRRPRRDSTPEIFPDEPAD